MREISALARPPLLRQTSQLSCGSRLSPVATTGSVSAQFTTRAAKLLPLVGFVRVRSIYVRYGGPIASLAGHLGQPSSVRIWDLRLGTRQNGLSKVSLHGQDGIG